MLLPLSEWLAWSAYLPAIRRTAKQQEPVTRASLQEMFTRIFLFSGRAYFLVYLGVLFGTGIWLWSNNFTWQQVGVMSVFAACNVVLGITCGLVFFGSLVCLALFQKRLVPQAQFLWEVPALYALGYMRWMLLLVGAIAVELWRVTTLTSLVSDGFSGGIALLLSAAVYALRLLPRGPYRVAYATFEGLVFGGLYLWLGSLLAPLTACLVCEISMFMIFRSTVPAPPDFSSPSVANCPLCGRGFSREEVKFKISLQCPQCRQVVGLPSWRTPVVKFSFLFGLIMFMCVFLEFSPGRTAEDFPGFVFAYFGALLATMGSVALIDVLSLRRLAPGSPGIPTLGLISNDKELSEQDHEPPT